MNLLENQPAAEEGAAEDSDQGETIHWLRDEVESAIGDTFLDSFLVPITSDDDDRSLKPLASDEAQDLRSPTPGHHEVADHRMKSFSGEESRWRLGRPPRNLKFYGEWFEIEAKDLGLTNFIVNYEDATAGHRSARPLLVALEDEALCLSAFLQSSCPRHQRSGENPAWTRDQKMKPSNQEAFSFFFPHAEEFSANQMWKRLTRIIHKLVSHLGTAPYPVPFPGDRGEGIEN